jgi:hypothetical protein
MTEIQDLKNIIKELEDKVKSLEKKLASLEDPEEKVFMEAIYKKAKDLIKDHENPTAIFLQKKLLIDFPRARKILKMLKDNDLVE